MPYTAANCTFVMCGNEHVTGYYALASGSVKRPFVLGF